MIRKLGIICLLLSLIACSKNEKSFFETRKVQPNVIYGDDNRLDLYDVSDVDWQKAAQSTVAVFDKKKLTDQGSHYLLSYTEYGRTYGLCQDEPFYSQPISSFCSGSLIGKDIVVTAGHCVRNEFNCEKSRFVFNYSYSDPNDDPTVIAKDDVFSCKEIIHTETNALTGLDFAIIRLDREVEKYEPLKIRTEDVITEDQSLVVIGHPSGLPAKLAGNGSIRSNNEPYFFVTNLDTYGGNSGSAVFNQDTKAVEGILVRGESDYVYHPDEGCRRSNKCPADGCRGEDVVRISVIFDYITPEELKNPYLFPPATLLTPPIVY